MKVFEALVVVLIFHAALAFASSSSEERKRRSCKPRACYENKVFVPKPRCDCMCRSYQECTPAQYWSENSCACKCPSSEPAGGCSSVRTWSRDECRCKCVNGLSSDNCSKPFKWYSDSCSCACKPKTCKSPKIQNNATCACECPKNCVSPQVQDPTSCQCMCPSDKQEPTGGCGGNSTWDESSCSCKCPGIERTWNATTNQCDCTVPIPADGCNDPRNILYWNTTQCACSCKDGVLFIPKCEKQSNPILPPLLITVVDNKANDRVNALFVEYCGKYKSSLSIFQHEISVALKSETNNASHSAAVKNFFTYYSTWYGFLNNLFINCK